MQNLNQLCVFRNLFTFLIVSVFSVFLSAEPLTVFIGNYGKGNSISKKISTLNQFEILYRQSAANNESYLVARSYFINEGVSAVVVSVQDLNQTQWLITEALPKIDFKLLVYNELKNLNATNFLTEFKKIQSIVDLKKSFFLLSLPITNNLDSLSPYFAQLSTVQSSRFSTYFPYLVQTDNQSILSPEGFVAAALLKNDLAFGIWKGTNIVKLSPQYSISQSVSEQICQELIFNKEISINCIKPISRGGLMLGNRVAFKNNSAYKYIPVVRYTDDMNQKIKNQLLWVTQQKMNNPAVWLKIKNKIDLILNQEWQKGALQGATPQESYFTKCGLNSTMSSTDITDGVVRIEYGQSVLRPGEFLIDKIILKVSK